MLGGIFNGYFWHPLAGNGYQFWSGIAGSFLTSLPGWLTAALLFTRHQNCHVKGCLRHGHPDPLHGWPACKKHHSQADSLGSAPN
jgi:hypothetical protein